MCLCLCASLRVCICLGVVYLSHSPCPYVCVICRCSTLKASNTRRKSTKLGVIVCVSVQTERESGQAMA